MGGKFSSPEDAAFQEHVRNFRRLQKQANKDELAADRFRFNLEAQRRAAETSAFEEEGLEEREDAERGSRHHRAALYSLSNPKPPTPPRAAESGVTEIQTQTQPRVLKSRIPVRGKVSVAPPQPPVLTSPSFGAIFADPSPGSGSDSGSESDVDSDPRKRLFAEAPTSRVGSDDGVFDTVREAWGLSLSPDQDEACTDVEVTEVFAFSPTHSIRRNKGVEDDTFKAEEVYAETGTGIGTDVSAGAGTGAGAGAARGSSDAPSDAVPPSMPTVPSHGPSAGSKFTSTSTGPQWTSDTSLTLKGLEVSVAANPTDLYSGNYTTVSAKAWFVRHPLNFAPDAFATCNGKPCVGAHGVILDSHVWETTEERFNKAESTHAIRGIEVDEFEVGLLGLARVFLKNRLAWELTTAAPGVLVSSLARVTNLRTQTKGLVSVTAKTVIRNGIPTVVVTLDGSEIAGLVSAGTGLVLALAPATMAYLVANIKTEFDSRFSAKAAAQRRERLRKHAAIIMRQCENDVTCKMVVSTGIRGGVGVGSPIRVNARFDLALKSAHDHTDVLFALMFVAGTHKRLAFDAETKKEVEPDMLELALACEDLQGQTILTSPAVNSALVNGLIGLLVSPYVGEAAKMVANCPMTTCLLLPAHRVAQCISLEVHALQNVMRKFEISGGRGASAGAGTGAGTGSSDTPVSSGDNSTDTASNRERTITAAVHRIRSLTEQFNLLANITDPAALNGPMPPWFSTRANPGAGFAEACYLHDAEHPVINHTRVVPSQFTPGFQTFLLECEARGCTAPGFLQLKQAATNHVEGVNLWPTGFSKRDLGGLARARLLRTLGPTTDSQSRRRSLLGIRVKPKTRWWSLFGNQALQRQDRAMYLYPKLVPVGKYAPALPEGAAPPFMKTHGWWTKKAVAQ